MLATLPKRAVDDVSGELLVAAYNRKLGHFSKDAISYLTDKALERQWFPTIFECLEILNGFERNDHWLALRRRANEIARDERIARMKESDRPAKALDPMTQADVDAMPVHLQNLGIAAGWLTREADGRVLLVPEAE